ncbi:phage minor capsid protein [Paenibacillus larvae]|uniref:Minor capsid protein n=1 Tax=Paenibacillus phage Tripp TaxID=1718161 RepID=A0A0N9SJR1_9CAUD|nr:phage minor capsid protein [Paenibacillus larvae]YP_009210525.1 minor head protein [Paenibacillus phage Tripp]ALH46378.1 minor capsid protein [Paenibacillus phage Tripp]ETK27968.1 putative phage protein [Paenibacillus larvae subsp. larvae DSM 25719]MDT2295669.1 minor capsid protein [Paenibacillus larvae]
MSRIPETQYDYDVDKLVSAFKQALQKVRNELNGMELDGMRRAIVLATIREIESILSELLDDADDWIQEYIPKAASGGVAETLVALGVVETVEEALKAVKPSRLNENMVAAAIADTQADILAVTQNVERKVRSAIKKAYADSLRENMAAGINGRRTISRDALDRMRQELGKSLDSGIIDAAGRRWRPDTYVEMLTRTKMMNTYREATTISALERDAQYAIISRHGATDACSNWEGKIIKLTAEAPGPYPTYDQLRATKEIFHPHCKHTFTPIRSVRRYEDGEDDPDE